MYVSVPLFFFFSFRSLLFRQVRNMRLFEVESLNWFKHLQFERDADSF